MAIYQKVTALNKALHRQHKVEPLTTFHFAADMQTIPVVANEFGEAAKEAPIVFVPTTPGSQELAPMLLLGLKNAENLYVADDGAWKGRYVPAFLRRYPFIFAQTGADQLTLCVDEDYAGFNTEQGARLFDAEEETDYLKGVLQLVTAYHRDSQLTAQFAAKLQQLGLLEEKSLKAELKDGREFVVQGFSVVNEAQFSKLEASQVHALFTSGELGLIFAHLISLSNLARLIDLATERGQPTRH